VRNVAFVQRKMSNNILITLFLGNCFTNTSPLCSSSRVELDFLEAALITRLVPLDSPIGGADTDGVLSEYLALVFISSSLLHTKDPFVVTIPAVKRLVRGREPLITRSNANVVLDMVHKVLLLFVERVAKDL
jgi:hypothetical protein